LLVKELVSGPLAYLTDVLYYIYFLQCLSLMFCVFFSLRFVTVLPLTNLLAYVSVLFPVLVLQTEINLLAIYMYLRSILNHSV